MASKKQEPTATHRPNPIVRFLRGQMISSDFFARNWLWILATIVVILVYITNKYNCQTKMEEIRRLNHELEVVKTERVRVRSRYMSRTRESSMHHLDDSLKLNLQVQERPPFIIKTEK